MFSYLTAEWIIDFSNSGVGNRSQYAYWDRPDRQVDLTLIRGDENEGIPPLKTILFWNGLFYYPDYAFGRGRQPFIDAKCPVTTCLATDDPYLLDSVDQYDAVMFHWPSLCDYPYVASRSEHQLFVMVSDESPQVGYLSKQYILKIACCSYIFYV